MKCKPTYLNGTMHSNSMDISAPNLQKIKDTSFIHMIYNEHRHLNDRT